MWSRMRSPLCLPQEVTEGERMRAASAPSAARARDVGNHLRVNAGIRFYAE